MAAPAPTPTPPAMPTRWQRLATLPVRVWRTASRLVRGMVSGDRPLAVVVLASVVLGFLLLTQPLQSYLDSRARVEVLELKQSALAQETARLEQRVADLNDPARIELLAREQQGFVRPGEIPYVLVPPEVERPRIVAPRQPIVVEPEPWWRGALDRIWEWTSGS